MVTSKISPSPEKPVSSGDEGGKGSLLLSRPRKVEMEPGKPPEAFHLYRFDLQRTGRTEFIGPKKPRVLKKIKVKGKIESPAALLPDGGLTVGTLDGYLYILNSDGTIRKEIKTESWVFCSPVVDGAGNIYAGLDNGKIVACTSSGEELWTYALAAETSSSPALFQGTLFMGAEDYFLHAISTEGRELWKFPTDGRVVFSAPAMDDRQNLYIGSDDCSLHQVKPGGTAGWKFKTGGRLGDSVPIVAPDGTVYVFSQDAFLYAVDAAGNQKWKYRPHDEIEKDRKSHAVFTLAKDGTIFVATDTGEFLALDEKGKALWTREIVKETIIKNNNRLEISDNIQAAPIIDGEGHVYVASEKGITKINPLGMDLWRLFNLGSSFYAEPIITPTGMIVVGSEDGHIYIIGD